MRVVVDTSIWSLALRRRPDTLNGTEAKVVETLRGLIDDVGVLMLGPIRQELLSGVRHAGQFDRLRQELRAFPDEVLERGDYEDAAAWGNRCRAAGQSVSSVDMLVCSVCVRREAPLLTADADFGRYARVAPLRLLA